jgi:hypothetical protein
VVQFTTCLTFQPINQKGIDTYLYLQTQKTAARLHHNQVAFFFTFSQKKAYFCRKHLYLLFFYRIFAQKNIALIKIKKPIL